MSTPSIIEPAPLEAPAEQTVQAVVPAPPVEAAAAAGAVQAQVKQTIEALEQWLDAIHVARSDRSS